MKNKLIKILLTSVGRRGYIIDYFNEIDNVEVHASNSNYTSSLSKADSYLLTPLIYDRNYIDVLINYCKDNNIDALMSLFDIDLLILGEAKKSFDEIGVRIIHAPINSLRICNDKWETYLMAKKEGIETPETFLSINEVINSIDNKELEFPLIIKPRWGMGSIGLYKVDNKEELSVLFEKCKREIFESYLKFETESTHGFPIIIQKCIEGKEFGLDVFNDLNGNYVGAVAKQKVNMRSGETDIGLTVENDVFIPIAKKLSKKLKHLGILSVDVFLTANGDVKLIEMNCRISGHYPISHCTGVNYPLLLIQWLRGGQVCEELLEYNKGIYVVKELNPVAIGESL